MIGGTSEEGRGGQAGVYYRYCACVGFSKSIRCRFCSSPLTLCRASHRSFIFSMTIN